MGQTRAPKALNLAVSMGDFNGSAQLQIFFVIQDAGRFE